MPLPPQHMPAGCFRLPVRRLLATVNTLRQKAGFPTANRTAGKGSLKIRYNPPPVYRRTAYEQTKLPPRHRWPARRCRIVRYSVPHQRVLAARRLFGRGRVFCDFGLSDYVDYQPGNGGKTLFFHRILQTPRQAHPAGVPVRARGNGGGGVVSVPAAGFLSLPALGTFGAAFWQQFLFRAAGGLF